jgi:hypothetical protein
MSPERVALEKQLSKSLKNFEEMERRLQPFIKQRKAIVMPNESKWRPGTIIYF